MSKPLTVWITTNWKILKEMGIPDHRTCLLRNLYAGQEASVRTGHGTTDWFQIRKGACQGRILSRCLFNLYAEYIMWNARLDEVQARIKIARRNINNLRYADDNTLMAESKEELKSLLMKVKEESEKAGLKLNIQKTNIITSCPMVLLLLLLSHFSHVRFCETPRWQPTRLPHPWDSPGKNTGVGCHFLLQSMHESEKWKWSR